MNNRVAFKPVCYGLVTLACSWTGPASSAEPGHAPPVSQQAERSFQQLQQIEQGGKTHERAGARATVTESAGHYDADQYLIGKDQGDLNKGRMVCQRVSELSARTDLAKQIRVMVKEHMVDRIRERTGREAEQDIELTREEIVQEYLQGVKIVDRQVDEEKKSAKPPPSCSRARSSQNQRQTTSAPLPPRLDKQLPISQAAPVGC